MVLPARFSTIFNRRRLPMDAQNKISDVRWRSLYFKNSIVPGLFVSRSASDSESPACAAVRESARRRERRRGREMNE